MFFYDLGVEIGMGIDPDTTSKWSELITEFSADANLCVNAVNGVIDKYSPATGFCVAGMAQLAAACKSTNYKSIAFAHRTRSANGEKL